MLNMSMRHPIMLTRLHLPFVLALSLLFVQCSVWDSVTAYFNTYYNAERLFNEAEGEVWAQADTRYTGRNWLPRIDPPSGTRTKFASVIEKCSKLLQYHQESNLVDDALLMIAKSYFYQGDFQQAERKCGELLDRYPNSGLIEESRVLHAYMQYKMANIPAAEKSARDLLNEESDISSDLVLARAAILLGQIETDNRNYGPAKEYFRKGAEWATDGDLRSTTYVRMAESAAALGEYEEAEAAYEEALNAATSYSNEFKGRIGAIRMRAKQGQYDTAIDELKELRDDLNYKDYFGEIDLSTADAYRESGDLEFAVAQYAYVDTAYARTEPGVQASYQLGLLYEGTLKQLDSARYAYERGARSLPSSEAGTRCRERALYLARYFQYRGEIYSYDTLLVALRTDLDSLSARGVVGTDSLAPAVRDSMLNARRVSVSIRIDSTHERRAFAMSELANLFYIGSDLKDSAWVMYTRIADEYAATPYAGRALFIIALILDADSTRDDSVPDSLYREVIRRFPDTEFAAESRRQLGLPAVAGSKDAALLAYTSAESLMLGGRGAEAIPILEGVIRDFPASPYAPKARYAIGWVYETQLSLPDSALANYRLLASTYPQSTHGASVRPMLAAVEVEQKAAVTASSVPVKDSVLAPVDQPAATSAKPDEPRVDLMIPTIGGGGKTSGRESRLRERKRE